MRTAKRSLDAPESPLPLAGAWWWVAACSVVGLAARGLGLGRAQFWPDEYATYMFATQPLSRLLGPDIRTETNPPYYYLLQKGWLLLGESREAMRSLPVLLGMLAVPLVFILGRRLAGSRTGVAAAALLATSPLHIEYARSVRSYPLLVASALAALACLAYLLPDPTMSGETTALRPRRRAWLWTGYVLSTLSALYAHNTAVLLPVLASILVVWMWATGRLGWRFAAAWALANLLVVAGFVPWLSTVLHQIRTTLRDFWIPASTPEWVRKQLMGTYPYEKWAKPILYALVLPGIWALRRRPVALAFSLAMAAGQPLALFLISLYRPMFVVRALIWPTGLSFIIIGAGLAMIRPRWAFGTSIAALGVLGLLSAQGLYAPRHTGSDVAALVEPLATRSPTDDLLVFAPVTLEWEYRYEARLAGARIDGLGIDLADRPQQLQNWFDSRFVRRDALVGEARRVRRVWLLREVTSLFPPPAGQGFDEVAAAFEAISSGKQRWESGRMELVRYDLAP